MRCVPHGHLPFPPPGSAAGLPSVRSHVWVPVHPGVPLGPLRPPSLRQKRPTLPSGGGLGCGRTGKRTLRPESRATTPLLCAMGWVPVGSRGCPEEGVLQDGEGKHTQSLAGPRLSPWGRGAGGREKGGGGASERPLDRVWEALDKSWGCVCRGGGCEAGVGAPASAATLASQAGAQPHRVTGLRGGEGRGQGGEGPGGGC